MLWLALQVHWSPEDEPTFIFKNFSTGIGLMYSCFWLITQRKDEQQIKKIEHYTIKK